jgi:hypothetical protein
VENRKKVVVVVVVVFVVLITRHASCILGYGQPAQMQHLLSTLTTTQSAAAREPSDILCAKHIVGCISA